MPPMDDRMETSDEEDEAPPMAVPIQTASESLTKPMESTLPDIEPGLASPPPPVPVLLLTGYLGSGKTTLVNYILSAKHGYRCAVLLNEIADTADIEKALVREPEGEEAAPIATDWVQLENGCICCSVKNDMVQALEGLLRQRDKFDYVIIETTGLANPGPVAAALWTDAEIESLICLDAIVTVVDAKNVRRHLHEPRPDGIVNEAQQQVAFADILLLNKIDLVSEAELDQVESDIAAVNAEVSIVRCERCVVDLGRILHTGLYTGAAVAGEEDRDEQARKEEEMAVHHSTIHNEESHGHHHNHDHEHSHSHGAGASCSTVGCSHPSHAHAHDPAVRTVTLHVSRPLNLERLRHWLDELLWEQQQQEHQQAEEELGGQRVGESGGAAGLGGSNGPAPDIFRLKGLLHVENSRRKWVLQGVHELYDVIEGPEWEEGAPVRSKVVFIGRHLDGERLQEGLEKCCCYGRGLPVL